MTTTLDTRLTALLDEAGQRAGARTARPRGQLRTGRTDWYRIENFVEQGTADIYLYDEIGYWGVTAQDFVRDLQALKVSAIGLHINSPGGDVFDGIAIYNSLRNHPATVTTYVDGLAASAASFIAMAGDRVVAERNAQLMIHDASGICIGNAADMSAMVELLDKASNNIADIYAVKAGGTVEQWRDAMRAETWYSAEEAVAAGLADEVAGEPAADDGQPAAANTWDLSLFAYSGRAEAPAPVVSNHQQPAPEPDPVPVFQFDPDEFRTAVKEAAK